MFGTAMAGALLAGGGGWRGICRWLGSASWGFAGGGSVPGSCMQALVWLLVPFPWRFGKIQLGADCVEEGMLAYNGRDWRSLV